MHKLEKFIAYKPEKKVISLRIPIEILRDIDNKQQPLASAEMKMINQMIVYALRNMDDTLSE